MKLLLSVVWGLTLVPAIFLMLVSDQFLQASPGQPTPVRMSLLVGGIWLYPVTVLASLFLGWRRRPGFFWAPLAHLAVLFCLLFGAGTFAP